MYKLPEHAPPDGSKAIVAWHILIAYQGATGAPDSVTRSREDARKLAVSLTEAVGAGADFEELALKNSDDPRVKTDHGKLVKMGRPQMEKEHSKAFSDFAFALYKFETGHEPLDTPAGFEVVRRME